MQLFHTFDGQQIGTDAGNLGTHLIEHAAQLLDVRFASSIVNGSGALGKHGSHDDIGCTSNTGFVQEHMGTAQFVGVNLIYATFGAVVEFCPQFLDANKVGV